MQIPLKNGIMGARINPQIDSPIKKESDTKINVDETEAINTLDNGFPSRSLKSLKNIEFINFIMFLSVNFINKAPQNIPINKNIDKNTKSLFFSKNFLNFVFLMLIYSLFKFTVFINFTPYCPKTIK